MLGGVDFAGRDQQAPFGERLRITLSPSAESMGGPLFDPMGRVIGIVGGSIAPGARSSRMDSFVSPGLWTRFDARNAATPITVLRSKAESAVTLEMLIDRQLLTPPLQPVPQLAFLGTTRSMPKLMDGFSVQDVFEFSRQDPEMFVYTMWRKKDKTSRVVFSARIYGIRNQLRVNVEPKKVTDGSHTRRSVVQTEPDATG